MRSTEKALVVKDRVEERLQFTRSDETRDERAGVGAARAAKRLEREREAVAGGYTGGSIYPSSIFHWQSVHQCVKQTLRVSCPLLNLGGG
jgi:hypothetical protein